MEYREIEPPPGLRHLAKVAWTLTVPDGAAWFSHRALPDGCLEIIHRLSGRSRWGGEQPRAFVAGMITGPADLELEAGSQFVALRLWPWTWNALATTSASLLVDRWAALAAAAPGLAAPDDPDTAFDCLANVTLDADHAALAALIPGVRSVDALSRASGWPHRRLQRWFARHVGVPPRHYLRLVRFEETLAGLQRGDDTLAGHAAERGFADQAHMAREFRAIGGSTARAARGKARGPFL
jgi:AraC-like DNA-binding protein